jgi:hypothetical protein
MSIRWTQIRRKKDLTQRRKGAKKKLCAFAPLREILLLLYLCSSDLYLWQKCIFSAFSAVKNPGWGAR